MTPDHTALLASVLEAGAGLNLSTLPAYQIESRLGALAAAAHPPTLDGLMAALAASPGPELRAAVCEALVDADTVFFRDREVFQHLEQEVLPALATRRGGPLRVWSAACGTGQEPYSLAMIAERAPALALDICASDLSERRLEKARAGAYTQFEVQRGLPIAALLRGFEKVEDAWRVRPELRATVRWRRFNLLDDTAALGRFDLILCRHVLGAMTAEARRTVLAGLRRALQPGGLLVLGLQEDVGDAPDMFEAAPGGRGLYQLKRGASAAA